MFMHIVTQVVGLITAQFTRLYTLTVTLLLSSADKLRVLITQVFQSVVNLLNQFVKTLSNFKALLAKLITAVQLTKAALKRVVTISGQTGLQLVTIARQTLQHVKALFKKGK